MRHQLREDLEKYPFEKYKLYASREIESSLEPVYENGLVIGFRTAEGDLITGKVELYLNGAIPIKIV